MSLHRLGLAAWLVYAVAAGGCGGGGAAKDARPDVADAGRGGDTGAIDDPDTGDSPDSPGAGEARGDDGGSDGLAKNPAALDGDTAEAAPGDAPAEPEPCRVGKVFASTTAIIAAFPAKNGILAVGPDRVWRATRAGAVRVERGWPRMITAALWDGERLIVIDRAIVTVFDEALNELGQTTLIESCAAAVLIPDGRMVCGPANDWLRIFYTYDLSGPKLVGRSMGFTYNGIPMYGIKGRPWFLTPSALLSVANDGALTERHRNTLTPTARPPIASSGNPASLVVDSLGDVYRTNDSCTPACLEKLGRWTQPMGLIFDGPEGSVFHVTGPWASRRDVMTGAVISMGDPSPGFTLPVASAVHDRFCHAITAVYQNAEGHVVAQVSYGGQ